jgi:hypothetical protein
LPTHIGLRSTFLLLWPHHVMPLPWSLPHLRISGTR